jgi:aminopeptidase N
MRPHVPILLVALLAGCAAPRSLTAPVEGVLDARTGRVVSFEAMIEDLASVPMVYVGESHTNPEHHEIQRRIIEALSDRNRNLMVGMEMLQRPYQEVLDRWTSGGMDEGTFVRESSWFDQWGWGWWTKSAVLRLARERRLRVIGLNVEMAIMAEIGRKGLAGLRVDYRVRIPADIDVGVKSHEKAIRAVFPSHPGMQVTEERFHRFYEAQCTMDETMAETAVLALRDAPEGSAMVVLAGGMHVMNFYAIPERARRRNGLDYRVVLPMDRDDVSGEDPVKIGMGRPADYLIFTAPTPEEGKPRIGLALRGGDAFVKEVVAGGAAAGAGMQAEDVLLSIDGKPVADLVDMRILLEEYAAGSTVRLRWRRGDAEMEGTATLQAPPPMRP